MRSYTRHVTYAAIIAAMYAALTHLQNLLLPGSATWAIQFRVSEALCVLSFFTPAAIPGLSVVEPAAAFYAMPRLQLPGVTSDEDFVLSLLRETGVLFVHGSGFGQKAGTTHFRVVFLPPEDILTTAFDRLEAFVRERHPLP